MRIQADDLPVMGGSADTVITPSRFGATISANCANFRLWAPGQPSVELELGDGRCIPMPAVGDGWFEYSGEHKPGTLYRYRLPDGMALPDPASRLQEGGVHGYSLLVGPDTHAWRCNSWVGRPWAETVLYELHAGVLGGYAGIEAELPALAALGITAIELMPIAEFPGARNWGYDGVLPFAPAAAYGTPGELKSMIDRAHELGISVLLDVVFNHFGPDGSYLHIFAPDFFIEGGKTPWGAAIDFDHPEVRAYFTACAVQWINEYRFDGLRLDAVHAIPSNEFLTGLARAVRQAAGPSRHIHLIVESDKNDSDLLSDFEAQWNDDFHHAVHVLLTGETGGYYSSYADNPARHLARVLREGFAFQGEVAPFVGRPKGKPSAHLRPISFVSCLQNHDQTGNRLFGERLTSLVDTELMQVATALLVLSPQIPMLFMGDEVGSKTPFHYFIDHEPALAEAVRSGRRIEFSHASDEGVEILDPNDPATFDASHPEPGPDADAFRELYTTLIRVRREALVPILATSTSLGASALTGRCVKATWRMGDGSHLELAANLGYETVRYKIPEGRLLFALGESEGDTLPPAGFRAVLGVPPHRRRRS